MPRRWLPPTKSVRSLPPTQKWDGHFLVEFHPDVAPGDARAMLLGMGLNLRDNPDLAPST